MVGMLFQFPFDTVKVRLQSQPHGVNQLFRGPVDCAVKGIKAGGLRSLYKGMSAPLVGAMIENSALFVAFNNIQNAIRRYSDTPDDASLSMTQLTLSGFLSGAMVSFVLTPVELVKCQLQVQDVFVKPISQTEGGHRHQHPLPQPPRHHGPLSVILHTYRTHGLAGFYHGHVGTFLREAGGGAAWFGTYELVVREFVHRKQRAHRNSNPENRTTVFGKQDLSTGHIMLAGAAAGMTYNATFFPADCIKSRQQTTEGGMSFLQVTRKVYGAEGWRGFYRGFGINLVRSAPTSAMIFATYELLSRHLPF
ncbi:hypothetical protein HKX48_007622 [Thoreauomyces humboldtii]|nr:hypothetical protein HKX48_007622 [Thoreauomyces humboldtii]